VKSFALTTIIAVSLAAFCTPAFTMDEATKAAAADCQKSDISPQKGITACTKVLDETKLGPSTKAALLYCRANFYVTVKNMDKAKSDFTAATQAYEGDTDQAKWDPARVSLVASSYAFLGQIAAEAQQCNTAKTNLNKAAATAREISERAEYEKTAQSICK
jgi:hypothetical protein